MIKTTIEILRGFQTVYSLMLRKTVYLIFACILLFTSCSIVKPVEFKRINSFKIEEKSGKVVFTSNLTLYNPNGFTFIIDKADIDIYAEDINLGKLQVPDTVIINKGDEFTGDFLVEVSLVKMLLAGKNIMNTIKTGKINLELKGFVEADVLWMHKRFEVEHKELIELKK